MKSIKLYKIVIVILIIINIVSVYFLFNSHNKEAKRKPREIIIEKLNFDNNQIKQYDILIKKHQLDIIKLDDEIFVLKGNLYRKLLNDNEPNDSLINTISKKQAQVEQIHYKHLLDIKALCNKSQLDDFKELTNDFNKIFSKLPSKRSHGK